VTTPPPPTDRAAAPTARRDDSFTTEFDEASTHRRTHGARWWSQLVTILVGAVLAGVAYGVMFDRRIRPEDAALGAEEWTAITHFRGQRINAWRMKEWAEAVPADAGTGPSPIGLWLGNSQMHTVNQRGPDEFVASLYASEILGWPLRTLSLPNASLQDHLVMMHWAMGQRTPDWVVVGVCYDDLREDGLRFEYTEVVADGWVAELERAGPVGARLAAEVRALGRTASGDLQGTTRSGRSTQQVTEDWIQSHLNAWPVWSKRPEVMARWEMDLRHVRNTALGVDASTKRPAIGHRTDKNMAALDQILATAKDRGMRVVVYIVPLRWDPEPPYILEDYAAWKTEVESRVTAAGAAYLDLDRLVPDEYWGSFKEQELDFMHFRARGHELLGAAIGEAIRGMSGTGGAVGR
jgi:hypothetical protein